MVHYDPYAPEMIENPYPVYARMREEAPVYRLEQWGAWALARFEDVWNLSAEVDVTSVASGNTTSHVLTKVQPPTPMFALMDPPAHTKVRSAVGRVFTPRSVARLSADLEQWVAEIFDAAGDEIDIVTDLGTPIAVRVASRLMGIADEEGLELVKLTKRFFARDPEVDGITEDSLAAMGEMVEQFLEILAARRKSGERGKDAISALLAVEVDGVPRPDTAIADDLVLLMNGGTDTFPKVLANLVRRLGQAPEQRDQVHCDRALLDDAFLEAVRVDMPTQHLCRVMLKDWTVRGETLRRGEPVLFLYASANRDEREFVDPDRFDIARRPVRHLGFGHGTHACIGRHAAALEARACVGALLDRAPGYEVVEERAERLYTDFVQGYASLPVRIR